MSSNGIAELASCVASNTAKYHDFLVAKGLPLPSHEPMPSLPDGQPPSLPEDIEAARDSAIRACHELHRLLLGPVGLILNAADEVNIDASFMAPL